MKAAKYALAVASVLIALVTPREARADDVMAYAVATNGDLYSVDLTTGTATVIGSTGAGNLMEGLALSPGGTLYGTDAAGNLYTVNTSTGAATLVGSTGAGDIEGLAFNGTTLLGSNFSSTDTTIMSINTSNASTTAVTTTTTTLQYVRAMTLEDSNDVFVTSALCSFPPCTTSTELSSINLTTGVVTSIGTLNDPNEFTAALAYNGTLYGLDSDGNEYIINPSNGDLTPVGNTGGQFWLDMTLATVPEPSTVLLLGIGLIGLISARRTLRFA